MSCTSRRVSGAIVVSRSCSGFISPRPLKRVTVRLARAGSRRGCDRGCRCAPHRRARSRPACRCRCGTAAASRRTRGRPAPAAGSAAGTARRAASRCAGRRSRRPRGCRPCGSAGFDDVGRARLDADRDGDVVHFLRRQHLAGVDFPGVQDLAAQRHHGLELAVARLLGRAAGGIAFDQEQFRARRDPGCVQSASLPGSAGRARRACARPSDSRAGASAHWRWRVARCARPLPGCWLSQSPNWSLTMPETKAAGSRDDRRSLVWPGELRIAHLHRQHVARVVPDVLGRELEAARQQVAELAELAHGFGEPEPEAVDVRAALRGRNQVDVAFLEPRRRRRCARRRPSRRLPARLRCCPMNGSSSAAIRRPRATRAGIAPGRSV